MSGTQVDLQVGFFSDKKDNEPDIECVYYNGAGQPWLLTEIGDDIATWMTDHPEGKVIIMKK